MYEDIKQRQTVLTSILPLIYAFIIKQITTYKKQKKPSA